MSNAARALAASKPSGLVPDDMPEHEVEEHRNVQDAPLAGETIITNGQAEKALRFLRDSARQYGLAKRRVKRASAVLGHTEAKLARQSPGKTPTDRKADARADQLWLDAAEEEAAAEGDLAELNALREAASYTVECWRTQRADQRSIRQ